MERSSDRPTTGMHVTETIAPSKLGGSAFLGHCAALPKLARLWSLRMAAGAAGSAPGTSLWPKRSGSTGSRHFFSIC